MRLKIITSVLLFLCSNLIAAKTYITVENLTSINFSIHSLEITKKLKSKYWQSLNNEIGPGVKKDILYFNRNSGIKNKQRYQFKTKLSMSNNPSIDITIHQLLIGKTIQSHLYQSLTTSINNELIWYDDRESRFQLIKLADRYLKVSYQAIPDGLDDNIVYRIEEILIKSITDEKTMKVLNYNTYMRPTGYFKNGQKKRYKLMVPYLSGYDVIALSELFDNNIRSKLINMLSGEYPYHSKVIGSDSGIEQDGGLVILSKWPILIQTEVLYKKNCSGADCYSDKGVLYTKILKGEKVYNFFATHMQSGAYKNAIAKRKAQLNIIDKFIKSSNILKSEPLILLGDLNIDSNETDEESEYSYLVKLLEVEYLRPFGHHLSFDPILNKLAAKDQKPELVDHIFYSKKHLRPNDFESRVIILKSEIPWRDYIWEPWFYDLSDHFPVESTMIF